MSASRPTVAKNRRPPQGRSAAAALQLAAAGPPAEPPSRGVTIHISERALKAALATAVILVVALGKLLLR